MQRKCTVEYLQQKEPRQVDAEGRDLRLASALTSRLWHSQAWGMRWLNMMLFSFDVEFASENAHPHPAATVLAGTASSPRSVSPGKT